MITLVWCSADRYTELHIVLITDESTGVLAHPPKQEHADTYD